MLVAALSVSTVDAQWRTEQFDLVAGWQAIYLRVDTDDRTIEDIFASHPQVEEIWRWLPEALDQRIVDSPDAPATGVEWQIWKRNDRSNTTLSVLYANSAYLIKVSDGAAPFTFFLKGRVTSPTIYWRTDGLNLIGFPTNPNRPPTIETYLSPAEVLSQQTEIYEYTGGALLSGVNPAPQTARDGELKRGLAYWIRTTKYADYDGPLRVRAAIGQGVDFGASRPTVRIVLSNRTDREMDATFTPTMSESAPGENVAPQAVPLTRRDALDGEFVDFSKPYTVTLRANETIGMTLGIDRSQLSGLPGDEAFSLVKVTDGEGLSEFYVPANAEVASLAGLWIGEAEITHVQNQLQRFQKDDEGIYLVDDEGRFIPEFKRDAEGELLRDEFGDPVPDGDTNLNPAAQVFRLKLILHVDDAGVTRLLNRIYVGVVGSDEANQPVIGLTTDESVLDPTWLRTASRISVAHLPKNTNIALDGDFGLGEQLFAQITIAHSDPNNPFIHAYHPDHDNLDARFESALGEGNESYLIERDIVFTLHSEAGIITDPSWGTTLLTGVYGETINGLHKNRIAVEGVFALRRVSDLSSINP